MISIVVCSVSEEVFNRFTVSVEATIGVPYEIIRIDNSHNKYNICQAYNKGIEQCKYELICFSHEDIEFKTTGWGFMLETTFKDRKIGLAGVFGTCYISLFPIYWVTRAQCEGQIIEGFLDEKPLVRVSRFPQNYPAEVIANDGVFLATTKTVLRNIRFSDDLLKGFHGYDFDISMQIRQRYKIVVVRELIIVHYSNGTYNASYYEAHRLLFKKWRKHLPAYISSYTHEEVTQLKLQSLESYFKDKTFKNPLLIKIFKTTYYATKQGVLKPWIRKRFRI